MHRKTNNKSARGNTYRQRLTRGLLALGYTQIKSTSRKYEVFRRDNTFFGRSNLMARTTFHVGKSGALRSGRTATSSYSLGEPSNQTVLYKSILKAGEAQASQPTPTP